MRENPRNGDDGTAMKLTPKSLRSCRRTIRARCVAAASGDCERSNTQSVLPSFRSLVCIQLKIDVYVVMIPVAEPGRRGINFGNAFRNRRN